MSRALAAWALASVLAVAAMVLLGAGGQDDRVAVRAEFENAAGLQPGSTVRVNGASVGSVDDIKVTRRDTAEVVLDLDSDARPGAGATAAVRPLNLLGEKFVDLQIGDRARPIDRISRLATSTPVELDDVLDVLTPATRDRLALLLGEAGIALGGRGEDLRASLRRLPRTLEDAAGLLTHVGEDTTVLERLLVEADRVADRVARERASLGRLVETGAAALEAPAGRRAALQATIGRTPPVLAQLRATLRRLDDAGNALRPAASGLRSTAPGLTRTLAALPGFRAAAQPALRTIPAVAPSLTRLGRDAAPVVRRLRPTAAELATLAADADPLTRTIDDGAGADLLGVMQNWALAIQTRDGVGHLFRVALTLTPDLVRQLDAYVDPPSRPRKRRTPSRRPRTTTNAGADVRKAIDQVAKKPVEQVTGAVKPTLDKLTETVDRLTQPDALRDGGVADVLDLLLSP